MEVFETKKDKLINLVNRGDYKKALTITKFLINDFNEDERRIQQIAYETLTGNGSMYKMLKIDTEDMITQSIKMLKDYVIKEINKVENRA